MKLVKRAIHLVENTPLSLNQVFLSLTFVIAIRNFLEKFLGATHRLGVASFFYDELADYIHVYLYFFCVFLCIAWVVAVFGKLSMGKAARLCVYLSPLIWLAPVADYIIYGGSVSLYHYQIGDMGFYYLNMLNPAAIHLNISQGARFEIFSILIAAFLFLKLHLKANWLRCFIAAFLIYTLIFLSGFIPAITTFLLFKNNPARFITGVSNPRLFALQFVYLFLTTVVLLFSKLWFSQRVLATYLLSLLFPVRLFFYLYLLAFGFLFALKNYSGIGEGLQFSSVGSLLSAIISISCLFVYAKIKNDVNDIAIDKISNPKRAIVKGIFSRETLTGLETICLFFSLLFIVLAGNDFALVYLWLSITACCYIYSVPPFRLRRWFPAGHLTLSAIGVLLFMLGVALVNPPALYTLIWRDGIIVYIAALFFVLSQFKDFKDVDGDTPNCITTLLTYVKPGNNLAVTLLLLFACLLGLLLQTIEMPAPFLYAAGAWVSGMLVILTAKKVKDFDRLFLLCSIVLIVIGVVWLSYHL